MTLPAKDDFATYGGQKLDYTDVVDPTTDRSAVEMNTALASASAMTRTAIRAIVSFAADGVDGYNNDVFDHESVWGNTIGVKPTVFHNSTGLWTITWPATVTDPMGVTQSVIFRFGWAAYVSGIFGLAQCIITSPNTIQVQLRDAAGNAMDGPITGGKITVFAI